MAARTAASLPRIKATIGHIPQRLKDYWIQPTSRARLEILRRIVTQTIREERVELKWNRASEARPYLIQLAIQNDSNGGTDSYANEMMEWWLYEHDLIDKMNKVLVPRFKSAEGPYTSIYRLPNQRLVSRYSATKPVYKCYEIAVLEVDGNPFPPVLATREANRDDVLANEILRNALKRKQKDLAKHD